MIITGNGYSVLLSFWITESLYRRRVAREIIKYSSRPVQFSSQIFNATRQLSHIEAAPLLGHCEVHFIIHLVLELNGCIDTTT